MASKNKHPMLGWHPPDGLSAWAHEQAGTERGALSALLTDALATYRQLLQESPEALANLRAAREKARTAAMAAHEPESAANIMAALRNRRKPE